MTNLMHRTMAWMAVFVLGAAGVVAAQAQTAPPPTNPQGQATPPRGGRGQRPAGAPGQAANLNQAELLVQEQWNVTVLKRSKMALGLTDQQFPLFFDKMSELQNLRDRHQVQRRRMLNGLGKLTGPDAPAADDATLLARVKDLADMEAGSVQEERQAIAAVDAVLTPFQRARFRVFEENMEKQKVLLLAGALKVK